MYNEKDYSTSGKNLGHKTVKTELLVEEKHLHTGTVVRLSIVVMIGLPGGQMGIFMHLG